MKKTNYRVLYSAEYSWIDDYSNRHMSEDEVAAYCSRIKLGDTEARNEFAMRHAYLVRDYICLNIEGGADVGDMFDAGFEGLLKAAVRYDPESGCKFSTYSRTWIKGAVMDAIVAEQYAVRIPDKARARMKERGEDLSFARPLSLDAPITTDDSGMSLMDTLQIPAEPCEFETNPDSILMDSVYTLPEKERFVILRSYGLGGYAQMTLEDIGKRLNVSKQRVSQIRNRAIKRLKEDKTLLENFYPNAA